MAMAVIWVSVVLTSILAPALVSGSQRDHIPIAALGDWIWGAVATSAVVAAALEGTRARMTAQSLWMALGFLVTAIWLGVLFVSIFTPDFVTGTDPTRLPFGAMLSPIAGLVLTGVICNFVKTGFERPERAEDEAVVTGVRTSPLLTREAVADDAAAKISASYPDFVILARSPKKNSWRRSESSPPGCRGCGVVKRLASLDRSYFPAPNLANPGIWHAFR